MSLVASLAAVLAPVFLLSLVGYLWGRLGLPFEQALVTRLVTHLGAPCLVFNTLARMHFPLDQVARVGGAALLCLLSFAVIGVAVLRAARLPLRVYLPSLVFPNIGNMGLPVCLFAFGEPGLAMATLYFAVTSVGQFTLGPAIASGTLDPAALLRVPFIYAVALGLLCAGLGWPLPPWLSNTCQLAAGLAIPLMLLGLGVALGELRVSRLGRALWLSALRITMGLAVGYAVSRALGLSGALRGVVILESSMPVAVFNYLFARMYDNSPDEVAGLVVVSTVLSYLSLPFIVALVR